MSRITRLEDLSHELFFEIFEHLSGNDLYKAFSLLNIRFDRLLHCSFLRYKIRIDEPCLEENTIDELDQISRRIRSQIFSISISSSVGILRLFYFSSSYENLQSILVNSMGSTQIDLFVYGLTELPQLYSLTIETIFRLIDFQTIYCSVFKLSKLKYFKFTAYSSKLGRFRFRRNNLHKEESTSIEHFIINHNYYFDELIHLLSLIPKVHYLKLMLDETNPINLTLFTQISFPNLTSLSMTVRMEFDTFQILINQFRLNLKKFYVEVSVQDRNYLLARRWENLIYKPLPKLEEFFLKYLTRFKANDQPSIDMIDLNEFYSPFWLQRQWILEIQFKKDSIIYYIHPYKKRWYEYERVEENSNSSFQQLSNSKQLTLMDISKNELPIENYFQHILPRMNIHHLDIEQEIFVLQLAKILSLLAELDSLKLFRIFFFKPRQATLNELIDVFHLTKDTKITKMYLGKVEKIEEVYFILSLCPLIKQIRINDLSTVDVQYILRPLFIQMKNRSKFPNLRFISIRLQTVDDQMICNLKQIIQDENLLIDFTIKRIGENISIRWT